MKKDSILAIFSQPTKIAVFRDSLTRIQRKLVATNHSHVRASREETRIASRSYSMARESCDKGRERARDQLMVEAS